MAFNINQRLNGINPLSYLGANAVQPPDFVTKPRPPTSTDSKNFYLGQIWLDTGTNIPATANDVYMLVGLQGNSATWVAFGGGDLQTLTGNSGGAVAPDGTFNINVVGDGTTINVTGNPGTNTLTISTVGTGVINTLTGNSGGAISPTAGNINIVGTGVISVVGNSGTSTLTVTPSGSIASSFITNPATGTATPVAGVLTFAGGNNITQTAAGSTVTTQLTGTTNHAVQVGNASGSLTSLAVGTTGQVLTGVTGSNPVWAAPSSPAASCSFFAYRSSSIANFGGNVADTLTPFDAELFDIGGNFDTTTHLFTAPADGYYQFTFAIGFTNANTASTEFTTYLYHSGYVDYFIGNNFNPTNYYATVAGPTFSFSTTQTNFFYMVAGQTVGCYFIYSLGANTASLIGVDGGDNYRTYFSGYRVA